MTSSEKSRFSLTAAFCLLATLFCCSAYGATHHHDPFYITFQVPNSTTTIPVGINDSLTVTGYYNGTDGKIHGFVRQALGEITSFDVPGSIVTQPAGINNDGEITGYYEDVSGVGLGFIRSREGRIATFNPGGSGGETVPRAISARGIVVGNYTTTNTIPPSFGFIRYPDRGIVTFNIYGSDLVMPMSVNSAGEITGLYYSAETSLLRGFVRYRDGHVTGFDYGLELVPTDINQGGTVTGWYYKTGSFLGFVRSRKGVITSFKVPGDLQTEYISINRAGFVTGSYLTSTPSGADQLHGFLRSPEGVISTFDPPESTQTAVTAINDLGVIIGSYAITTPDQRGFLRIPQFDCDDDDSQHKQ